MKGCGLIFLKSTVSIKIVFFLRLHILMLQNNYHEVSCMLFWREDYRGLFLVKVKNSIPPTHRPTLRLHILMLQNNYHEESCMLFWREDYRGLFLVKVKNSIPPTHRPTRRPTCWLTHTDTLPIRQSTHY